MREPKTTRIIKYIMPAAVAGIIYLTVLVINGLWPFGRATIDYYDMAQWSDLFYYHNYDELFGQKSFIFDWYTNLGRVIPGLNEPSPLDLLFYLVPRDLILECMSLLMLVKIMLAAFFMGLFLKYVNEDLPYPFWLILSAGYGMCGFVLVNYTVPQWIDMAAVVPLILLFSQKALKEGRFIGLSVTVFLIMILDYYFTIQTLIFVFLTGGAYDLLLILRNRKKSEKEKLYFTRLLAGVAMGLGLSAFSWLPDIMFGLTSARFGNGMDDGGLLATYLNILGSVQPAYMSRWFSLLGLAFPAAVAAIGMYGRIKKKDILTVIFCLLCLFMITSQLFVESIHLILHFGSYVDYPMRNGFMIYCMAAGIAAGLYEKKEDAKEAGDGNSARSRIMIVAGVLFTVAAVGVFKIVYSSHAGISDHTVFLMTMGIMVVFALIHMMFILMKNGRYMKCCIALWAVEMLIFGVIMIGKPIYDSGYGDDPEQEGEFIRITDQLVREFDGKLATGEDAATRRIKNPDTSLNANYGSVMKRETLSGWSNLASAGQIDGAVGLGYTRQFTRILDSGGNIFSDTLLHITDVISHMELDDKLYEKTSTADVVTDHMTGERTEYHLYRNRYELPFAIPVSDSTKLPHDVMDTVELVNSYAAAIGAKDKIAGRIAEEPEVSESSGHEIKEFTVNVKGKKTLYLNGNCSDAEYRNTRITVNGKTIGIPSIKENSNDLFPAHFNNKTVELGSFDDETAVITVDMDISDPDRKFDYYIYYIDRDVLSDLCTKLSADETVVRGRHSLDVSIGDTAAAMEGVMVPVSYDPGWSATVDGKTVQVEDLNGLFMYVPAGGGHDIHMSYFPPYMKTGMIIAAVTLMVSCIAHIWLKKERKMTKADDVISALYVPAFLLAFVIVYLIPVVFAVKYYIS